MSRDMEALEDRAFRQAQEHATRERIRSMGTEEGQDRAFREQQAHATREAIRSSSRDRD